jgi:hypothetical protein
MKTELSVKVNPDYRQGEGVIKSDRAQWNDRRVTFKGVSRRQTSTIKPAEESLSYPAPDTLARTKRLLLAALKVWELKQGIRD